MFSLIIGIFLKNDFWFLIGGLVSYSGWINFVLFECVFMFNWVVMSFEIVLFGDIVVVILLKRFYLW